MSTASSLTGHENKLSSFYGSFPYPWRPTYFETMSDPSFHFTMVKQETGRYDLGPFNDIWVAGCGTNQALITALRFPEANVLGTDVSARSLEICAENARKIGVTNVRLEQQGVTHSDHLERFDLVICTGVIHHNPEPQRCLARLSAALRDHGVLELMVYNQFHRREPAAFQEALGILIPDGTVDHWQRLAAARSLADSIRVESTLTQCLRDAANGGDAAWADTWMNPCEASYDVNSLWDMARECGLVIEAPRLNVFDKARKQFLWTLELTDPELRDQFLALDDRARWQLVNLLHLNSSPMLWFYLRPDRTGAGRRVSEADRNRAFLDGVLHRPSATRQRFMLRSDGNYDLNNHATAIRDIRPPTQARDVWEAADGTATGREIFTKIGRSDDFNSVYKARIMLTSTEFPHLIVTPFH